MGKFIDLTGQRFGRLLVTKRNGTGNTGQAVWLCSCDCGKEANVLMDNLRRGKQVSCGCYHLETITTHGATTGKVKTAEYKVWQEMRRRCYDENGAHYKDYGGRGITVCDRWINSFENFLGDMGKRTSSKHSIDRIHNDGDYEPSNCHWATGGEQANNQRMKNTNTSGHKGVSWDKAKNRWIAKIIINYKPIHLGTFKTIEEAVEAREKAEIRYHNKQPSS